MFGILANIRANQPHQTTPHHPWDEPPGQSDEIDTRRTSTSHTRRQRRSHTADQGELGDPLAQLIGARCGKGASTRYPKDAEALDAKRVGEFDTITGPIKNSAVRLEVGEAEARTIWRDEAQA